MLLVSYWVYPLNEDYQNHPKMVGYYDGLWLGLLPSSIWFLTSFRIYDRGVQRLHLLPKQQILSGLRSSRPAARWSSSTPNIPQYPAGDPLFNWVYHLVICPLSIKKQHCNRIFKRFLADFNCMGTGQPWDTNGPTIYIKTPLVSSIVNLKVLDLWHVYIYIYL